MKRYPGAASSPAASRAALCSTRSTAAAQRAWWRSDSDASTLRTRLADSALPFEGESA